MSNNQKHTENFDNRCGQRASIDRNNHMNRQEKNDRAVSDAVQVPPNSSDAGQALPNSSDAGQVLPNSYEDSVRFNHPSRSQHPCALIASVDKDSPAWDAGFEAGYAISEIDGHPIHDIIDWRWYSADDEMEVTYITPDGQKGTAVLDRYPGEGWGFHFDQIIFDDVYQCRNACIFCFMRQLPKDSRKSLRLRDDDFRLSFLEGTYVTFTNLNDEQVQRIIEQHISPLRFSLHAINPDLRQKIIGKHAARGIEVAETLLSAGIQLHVQIVLMPGINDGEELRRTIEWCWKHPGIVSIGIVPLGYTSYQEEFHKSFQDPKDSLRVIEEVLPFQARAQKERGRTWVYLADEFYRNAYGNHLIEHLPSADSYDGYPLFEDGIGMLRSTYDEWTNSAYGQADLAHLLDDTHVELFFVCGEALRDFVPQLLSAAPFAQAAHPLFVKNNHFGGNVNVTGLLCADDIIPAAKQVLEHQSTSPQTHAIVVIPDVIFNADAVTLDGCSILEIQQALNNQVCVVSCEAPKMFYQIQKFIKGRF